MSTLVSFLLDLTLIGLLIAAIVYAIKLTHQLTGLRQSRVEMERFIAEFNSIVGRAEAGIRGLKQAARSGGDDLERLIERGGVLRDELTYLIESADQAATRLTDTATKTTQARPKAEPQPEPQKTPLESPKIVPAPPVQSAPASNNPASGAERELLRVLGKLR